jgi:hypothetical protein
MRCKVRAWKVGVSQLRKQSRTLMGRYVANSSSVTPVDWDRLSKGSPRKLRYIYHNTYTKESWLEEVAYLNMIVLAVYQEKRCPRAHWSPSVPCLSFTAPKEYQEKLWPRALWPRDIPYLDLKAQAKCHEKRWPRAKWPKSVPCLEFVALAEYVKERGAESAKVTLT